MAMHVLQLSFFDLTRRADWRAALARFAPCDDVYFSPEYHAASASLGGGEPACILAEAGGSALLLPYLRCPIPGGGGWCDVQSAYGYGGPLVLAPSADFLAAAWSAIFEHWRGEGVIAAFLRCHPLIGNAAWFASEWSIVHDRSTVAVDLGAGVAAAFAQPGAGKHRRDTAQAVRAGASVVCQPLDDAGLNRFQELYRETMSRVGAGEEYFFSRVYFEMLITEFREAVSLVEVRAGADGAVLSAALVFWGSKWAHYHLSARRAIDRNATHLLLQAVVEEAARRGLAAVHLGGGRTPSPEDSLLRFKKWVGNSIHRFDTARLVVNRSRYDDLVAAWSTEHPDSKPLWFLTYRQEPPSPKPINTP